MRLQGLQRRSQILGVSGGAGGSGARLLRIHVGPRQRRAQAAVLLCATATSQISSTFSWLPCAFSKRKKSDSVHCSPRSGSWG